MRVTCTPYRIAILLGTALAEFAINNIAKNVLSMYQLDFNSPKGDRTVSAKDKLDNGISPFRRLSGLSN